MNDEIKEAAENCVENIPEHCTGYSNPYDDDAIIFAFTAGANYATEKCQAQLAHHIFEIEKKNKELEKKLGVAREALNSIEDYGEYPDHKETPRIWRIAYEALEKIGKNTEIKTE